MVTDTAHLADALGSVVVAGIRPRCGATKRPQPSVVSRESLLGVQQRQSGWRRNVEQRHEARRPAATGGWGGAGANGVQAALNTGGGAPTPAGGGGRGPAPLTPRPLSRRREGAS